MVGNQNIFINVHSFLDDVLHKPIRLTAKSEIHCFDTKVFQPQVRLTSLIFEGNLRMIDTYLPEILFMLAYENTSYLSIEEAISRFEGDILNRDKLFTRQYFKVKLLHFFEAVLFARIFKNVWHGKWERRYFVTKDERGQLMYYDMVNARELIFWILNNYIIGVTRVLQTKYEINFRPIVLSSDLST